MEKYIKLFTPTKSEKQMIGVIGACALGLGAVSFVFGAGLGLISRINN